MIKIFCATLLAGLLAASHARAQCDRTGDQLANRNASAQQVMMVAAILCSEGQARDHTAVFRRDDAPNPDQQFLTFLVLLRMQSLAEHRTKP